MTVFYAKQERRNTMSNLSLTAFVGGEIITVDKDNDMKVYESMLINGSSIVYLGDRQGLSDVIRACDVEVIDLKGRSILPGFIDSHLHASSMTEMVFDADLLIGQPGMMFPRDEALRRYRQKMIEDLEQKKGSCEEPSAVVRGAGWNPGIFMGDSKGLPTWQDLEGIDDSRPLLLRSYDHHFLWVNHKALEIAGLGPDTPEPRNGRIYRDEEGNPTGVFQENTAIDLLMSRIPGSDYTVEEYKRGILAFQDTFGHPLGMTGIFDAYNSDNGMQAYCELAEEGKLAMRVRTCYYADPAGDGQQFAQMIDNKESYHVGDLFQVNTVKFFMDGTGLTFCLYEPFEKDFLAMMGMPDDYCGYSQWNQEEVNEIFTVLDKEGYQIHVHCMGDKAAAITLNGFETAARANGNSGERRHTIAHLMQVTEEDIHRMGKLGVVSAMQPMWAQYASLAEEMSSKSLGMERVLDQYRIGSLLKAGSIVSFGTDFPVTIPPDPILGIQTAITRSVHRLQPDYERFRGRKLGPEDNPARDCLNRAEAIGAYCYGGAYQCFMEELTGSLEEGKSADFVILSGKLSDTADEDLCDLHVDETWFCGRKVYCKE